MATYDWRGNLLSWGGGSYSYDAVGNLQSVGTNTVHLYTASDERIGTLHSPGSGSPLEETYTLRSAGGQVLREMERDDSMPPGQLYWNRDYVWRGGQLLATDTTLRPWAGPPAIRHFTLNHVGSPVLVTSRNSGIVAAEYDYAPFGEEMSPSSNPPAQMEMPMRFTGHERDFLGSGELDDLDYMHARHYTPYVGRFLQVDPVGGSLGSPQSWNRYAYVRNDPVNFTDPRGSLAIPLGMYRGWRELCDRSNSCITVTGSDPGDLGGGGGFATHSPDPMSGIAWGPSDFDTSLHSGPSGGDDELGRGIGGATITVVTEILPSGSNAGVKSDQTVVVDTATGQIKSNAFETGRTDFCPGKLQCLVPSRSDWFTAEVSENNDSTLALTVTGETGSWGFPFANINYSFTFSFDRSSGRVSLEGFHDGYPSYLVLIGAEANYYHEQGWIGELSGWGDVRVGD